jgi:hypothetical protein
MKRNRHIPEMSIYEASDFWDEHEFDEFDDVQEVDNIRFELRKKKYVGIDMNLFTLIKNQAQKLHTTEDVLINTWLREKVAV